MVQSHGSKPLDIQTWPGQPGEVHTEPQNEEESDFESSTLVRPSLGFTEDGVKKRQSAEIMSDSSLGENASLMSEVGGEWTDCFELIGKQQDLK